MERLIMITSEGAFLSKSATIKEQFGKCYKCAFYKHCTDNQWRACNEMAGSTYFVKPRLNLESINVNPADLDFSNPKVRYKGEVVDKYGLHSLIHDTDFMLGNEAWPTAIDIYWDNYTYESLKKRLISNVRTLEILIKYNP